MAKIYETQADLEKDVLKQQAQNLRLQASRQGGSGGGLISLNLFTELWHATGRNLPGWLRTAGNILGIVGIIKIVRSYFTDSKAHNLELQRERMGPTTVVLPPEITVAHGAPAQEDGIDPSCGCPLKRHAASHPTSLLEQAMRGDTTLQRE